MALVGTADLVLRRATLRGVRLASFMVLQSWVFGSTALTWTLATDSFRWHPGVLLGPVAGLLAFVATHSFLRSLQAPGAQVSVNAAIHRLNLAVTALLALALLGERTTAAKLGGLALAGASAAVPVSQMSFVFTFLLAAPLFREPVTPRKLAGLAAAILAVLALSVPGSGRER